MFDSLLSVFFGALCEFGGSDCVSVYFENVTNELFSLWGPHRCWRRMKECKGRCDDEYTDEYATAMMECAAVRVLIDYKKCTELVVVVPRDISRAFVFSLFFSVI